MFFFVSPSGLYASNIFHESTSGRHIYIGIFDLLESKARAKKKKKACSKGSVAMVFCQN